MISLTPAELQVLTGYRSRAHQAKFLDHARLPYRTNKAGQIIVSRAVAEAYLGGSTPAAAPAAVLPDFSALRLIQGRAAA